MVLLENSKDCLVVDVLQFDARSLVNLGGGDLIEGKSDLG